MTDRRLHPWLLAPLSCGALCLSPWLAPPAAQACGATPCDQRDSLQPADGATGVPTNTEVRLRYFGTLEPYDEEATGGTCATEYGRMRLIPEGGDPDTDGVELDASRFQRPDGLLTWFTGKPAAALQPNTRYTVQLRLDAQTQQSGCGCGPRAWGDAWSFTTGAGADDDSPVFAGADGASIDARVDADTGCGPVSLMDVALEYAPASDAGGRVRYNVYVDGELATPYVEEPLEEVRIDCGSGALLLYTLVSEGADVELRAVDLAGNESAPNAATTLAARCNGGPVKVSGNATPATGVPSAPGAPNPAPSPTGNHPSAVDDGSGTMDASDGDDTAPLAGQGAQPGTGAPRHARSCSVTTPGSATHGSAAHGFARLGFAWAGAVAALIVWAGVLLRRKRRSS